MNNTERRKSIQDILNQMAGRVDALLDARDETPSKPRPVMLDEIHTWAAVDPLLADLHKQYLDARANHARLKGSHGARDAMAAIAADMEDSARCAIDTRILELRQCGEARALLQAIIRKAHDAREATLADAERARSSAYWKDFAIRKAPHAAARGQNSFFMLMVGVILLQQIAAQATHHLSLVDAFYNVAAFARRRVATV